MEEEKDNQQGALSDETTAMPNVSGQPDEDDTAGGEEQGVPTEDYDPEIDGQFGFFDMLMTVPVPIREYLLSPELDNKRKAIYDQLELSEDDRQIAMFTEYEVFFGDLDLEDYANALWSRLPWKDSELKRAKKLAAETLGQIFLPASAFLGDVMAEMVKGGIDPKDYSAEMLAERVVTYEEAAKQVVRLVGAGDLPEATRRRLENIIESRLRDVRDEDETMRMLTKSKKTGGLEMSDQEARRIVHIAGEEMRMTSFVEVMPAEAEAEAGESRLEISPEQIRARLAGSAEEQKEFVSRLEALERDSGGDAAVLKEVLHDLMFGLAVENNGQWDVVAALVALARHEGLVRALLEDERYASALEAFLQERGLGSEIAGVKAQPAGVKAMNFFLQMVLRGVALLDEEGSARYGLRVTNVLKSRGEEQYSELVAFDMDEGKFVWAEPLQM